MAEIFRPVSRIGERGGGAEDLTDIGGELLQGGDGGVAGIVPDPGEAPQLGADEEGRNAACGLAQMGVVQDLPAIGPFRRAGIGDGGAGDREVAWLGCAEEGRDLRCCRGRRVR